MRHMALEHPYSVDVWTRATCWLGRCRYEGGSLTEEDDRLKLIRLLHPIIQVLQGQIKVHD
jgi:hypothetical protein